MNIFDHLQTVAFRTAEAVFGDVGVWDGETITGLYREPTVKEREYLGDSYSPNDWAFEYFVDRWVGLKTLVDAGQLVEISVKGVAYNVRYINQKYDGKTFVAFIQPKQ